MIIEDIIPSFGYCTGNQRIAILGDNFVDSDQLLVQFGTMSVKPEFHENKTLICVTPPSSCAGLVSVRIYNGRNSFSEELLFEYI